MVPATESRTVKSVKTTLEIVNALKELNGAGVTVLADELDIAPSTVHSHLSTLLQEEYVVKIESEYHLGLEFLNLGKHAQKRVRPYVLAEAYVEKLIENTNLRAHFTTEEHGRGVYLYAKSGDHGVQVYSDPGKRFYLHTNAAGKAMLAHFPEDYVDEIIERWGLPQKTPNTITDREELFEELETIRERGVAFNRDEHFQRLRAVGAAVILNESEVIGAFSVSGPAQRMDGEDFEREIPELVRCITDDFEVHLTYQ